MSVRTDIFKTATKPHWVSQRERAATREALIGVAKGLVARNGETALTLGAVADEAGMARATVYGFFSGRGELLRALVPGAVPEPVPDASDPQENDDPSAAIWVNYQPDLLAFLPESVAVEEPQPTPAPQMAEEDGSEDWIVYEAAPPVEEAQAAVEEEPPVAAEVVEVEREAPAEEPRQPAAEATGDAAPASEPAAQEQPVAAEQSEPVDEDPRDVLAEQDERRRQHAAHLEEIAKRLILPESAIREGTDAVIARLDTRIRVLEKSISGLETRQAANETEAVRRLKPVNDEIEQLQGRADGADARQMKTVAELRLSIHQLETRMEALEGPQRGAVSGTLGWAEPAAPVEQPQPETPAAEAPASEIQAADAAQTEEPSDAAPQSENPKHAYLTAVRGIAKEGARQAAEREAEFEEERARRRRRMMAAAAVAIISLGAAGALFIFHPGSHGVSQAQSKPAPVAPPMHPALAPLDRLSAMAEKGNASAELLIGLKYLEGGHDDALAAHWLDRAADHGNAVAQNALGALYQSGRGVHADPAKATKLYLASAAQGNRHAMSNLAVLYAGADESMKDFSEAARWFERSASLGYVDAQFNLAVLYERGDGVPQSLLDAYKWYAIAAKSGDAIAKTRTEAIATQLSSEELSAAQKAVAEFKPQTLNKQANDVPSMPQVLAAK
ncbi:MAG TPA: TetR family transcriptional regulator [Rhizomicrobium sp.]|nr:TetR family transcriptional regulator [Rhizomicrobium sp.]